MTAVPAFRTPLEAPAWRRRLLYSPVARIVLFALVLATIGFALHGLLVLLGWTGEGVPRAQGLAGGFLQLVAPTLVAYWVLVRWVERRRARELATPRLLRDIAVGVLAGLAYITSVVAVLWLLGAYTVVGTRSDVQFAGTLLVAGIGAGVAEEILFRGVLFRIVEEGLGTWAALLASALLFGFAHISNPGATVWSSVAIAIEAGLLLGMTYQVSRSLPLCMALHAAWNFSQGKVFGSAVSGLAMKDSWLVPRMSGPDWLTGGAFGLEASVVAATLGLLVSAWLVVLARRRGTLVPWLPGRRRATAPAAAPQMADHGVSATATAAAATPPC
jgi:membrane protease YdiL (CAAX protease family)